MDLQLLRNETRAQHEATESLLSFDTPALDRPRYVHILQRFYRFVQGWEDWAARHVPEHLGTLLQERTRAPLLLRDLEFFGAAPLYDRRAADTALLSGLLSAAPKDSPTYEVAFQEAAFLGSMYVLEGSTLGGQYIARQVEPALGLEPGEGDAYFRGYGERTGAMWNAFRGLLAAIPEEHAGVTIAAAKATFEYVQETIHFEPGSLHR